ncbi:Dak1 domain-containing protein [Xylariales sp. PMI_506]|nr:Dak1 domain-containing protein [Xylariales sp. PMI_506]
MSSRHFFTSADGLVNKCIRGMIAYNPSLAFDEPNRVVIDTTFDRSSRVALISGGGSGHEPAWTGYVGENMLAASVAGDIFASPSTKQILAAIRAVASDRGTILVVTNYTGDCLHFGLANEKAVAAGYNCRMIVCGDDVSVGRQGERAGSDGSSSSRSNLVGRRGLAGQIGVLKVMGGVAGAGASLDEVYDLGLAVSQQIVSIAATLDHCHVPGRRSAAAGDKEEDEDYGSAALASDEVEIGTGPHNEPGYQKISPQPSPEDFVARILKLLLDETDPRRGYVKFSPGDETVLLVSNFGGMSYLEMGALVDEILVQLERDWNIEPAKVYFGQIETSLNAPAFSVSVINITAAAASCSYSVDDIKSFFDAKTTTHWESMAGRQHQSPTKCRKNRKQQLLQTEAEPRDPIDKTKDLKLESPRLLEEMLQKACDAVIAAEPDLTRWDTVMGDGDCGETLKTGASALLAALAAPESVAAQGSVTSVLLALEDIVESKMGGTLGGILGIFFVALRAAVEEQTAATKSTSTSTSGGVAVEGAQALTALWAQALGAAIASLRRYTPAAVGDRTVMDTLIPFAEVMKATGSFEAAVDAAVKGAEATKTMRPRLGRATYVGAGATNGTNGQLLPPDPGAWGAMVAIRGLYDGYKSA